MNNFGKIKTKLLKKITEAYEQGEFKHNTKNLINVIKKNKDFKEMYLFYEEIENKYFEDKEVAKLYVEEIGNILKQKSEKVKKFCEVINMSVYDTKIEENELYDSIDQLMEEDSLKNIDKKVIAKQKLVEHLTTKKEIKESNTGVFTSNENLLHSVLVNNFNVLYDHTLNEDQKKELKTILTLSNDELLNKTNELKESVLGVVETLLSEQNDQDLSSKLMSVKTEVNEMSTTKYNYYKLLRLKDGLS
jgi:hypothetical protein